MRKYLAERMRAIVKLDDPPHKLALAVAIGVFIGFTLSQSGLVVHWRRERPPGWRRRAAKCSGSYAVRYSAIGLCT